MKGLTMEILFFCMLLVIAVLIIGIAIYSEHRLNKIIEELKKLNNQYKRHLIRDTKMTYEELLEKQLIFESETFGTLYFVPCNDPTKACRRCLLARIKDECLKAPCGTNMRVDMQNGYYSINDMPV